MGATSGTLVNGNYSKSIANFGVRQAKDGYWYMALKEDRQTTANGGNGLYAQDTDGTGDLVRNTSRFGFAALPASYGASGTKVFIVNEGHTVFWRDFGEDVLETSSIPPTMTNVFDGNWPTDAPLAAHWHKVD